MKINRPLKRLVEKECPWLLELGFQIVGYDFRPESFGNSFVTLASDTLRVRFVRDHGRVTVEVASPAEPRKWWPVRSVLEAIHGGTSKSSLNLEIEAEVLHKNLPQIIDALGRGLHETQAELERRSKGKEADPE